MPSRFSEEFSTDVKKSAIVTPIDFRAATLLEESLDGGYTRVTKPVGQPTSAPAENQTTGGARMGDAIDAARIGALGRKNQIKQAFMPTFTPPKVKDNPPILPDSKGLERRLWRYFPNRARYVLVFKLSDGTFVQDTATPENSNTNIPYPYNPWNPEAPYSTSYFVNYEVNPPVPTSVTVSQNPYVVKVYMNVCQVTTAEATALTNAGYGALIS